MIIICMTVSTAVAQATERCSHDCKIMSSRRPVDSEIYIITGGRIVNEDKAVIPSCNEISRSIKKKQFQLYNLFIF